MNLRIFLDFCLKNPNINKFLGHFEIISRKTVVRMYSLKHVLSKIPQNPQKNTCIRVWFLIKLQTKLILKRDSRTDASPRILPSFQEHLFWRTSTNGCFWIFIFFKTRHVHIILWRILGFQHNLRSFYNEYVMSLLFSAVYDLKDHIWIRI